MNRSANLRLKLSEASTIACAITARSSTVNDALDCDNYTENIVTWLQSSATILSLIGNISPRLDIIKEMGLSSKQAANLLGVSVDAPLAEINKTWRQLARTCHPDLHPGDKEAESKYRRLNEAYTILSTIQENARRKRGMEEDILDNEFERWIKKLDPQKRKNIRRKVRRLKKEDDKG